MKIVHIVTRLLRAGSEENTLITAAGQIADGHEVTLIHGHEAMPDLAIAKAPGLRLAESPSLTREVAPLKDMAAWREIRRILRGIGPDVVHTHQSKAGIVGRWAASSAGVPLVVHGVHIIPYVDGGAGKRSVFLACERAAARVTDGFIHVSEGMRRISRSHGVGPTSAHDVVPSGFDLRRFRDALPPEPADPAWGGSTPGRGPVIAMLAALEPRKGHAPLLRAISGVLRARPDARLVLAGEGAERGRVEAIVAELGLADRVAVIGYRTDPERIVAMADLCVHCSALEGLPRSVLQYLAAGKPVAMFDLPGLDEVVEAGSNAVVVPQGDWGALIDAVTCLLDDPLHRARIAAGAAATDLARWDADLMAGRTTEIYRRLLEAKTSARAVAA